MFKDGEGSLFFNGLAKKKGRLSGSLL